jgi:pimeloyl-ACP methyl ester carboxylesterase
VETTHRIETTDGRTLEVHEAGDASGFPVIVHHGTPMSGLQYDPHVDLALEQGIRLIGYDRPGYGGSSRARGRTVADCVADVTAIADALGLERFASWGISGGGPHVLACGALCDERLTAVACLAGVAPWGAEGLDWLDGMGEDNHIEFGKALEGEETLRPYVEEHAKSHTSSVDALIAGMATLLGAEERAVLSGRLAEYFIACDTHAFAPGVVGWIDDALAFAAPWGFELAAISRPVLLLQGEDDRFVPPSHGHWLAARIPGVEARITASDGHLTLPERRLREVDEWLLSHS